MCIQGIKGDDGTNGLPGSPGIQGETGVKGFPEPSGQKGVQVCGQMLRLLQSMWDHR